MKVKTLMKKYLAISHIRLFSVTKAKVRQNDYTLGHQGEDVAETFCSTTPRGDRISGTIVCDGVSSYESKLSKVLGYVLIHGITRGIELNKHMLVGLSDPDILNALLHYAHINILRWIKDILLVKKECFNGNKVLNGGCTLGFLICIEESAKDKRVISFNFGDSKNLVINHEGKILMESDEISFYDPKSSMFVKLPPQISIMNIITKVLQYRDSKKIDDLDIVSHIRKIQNNDSGEQGLMFTFPNGQLIFMTYDDFNNQIMSLNKHNVIKQIIRSHIKHRLSTPPHTAEKKKDLVKMMCASINVPPSEPIMLISTSDGPYDNIGTNGIIHTATNSIKEGSDPAKAIVVYTNEHIHFTKTNLSHRKDVKSPFIREYLDRLEAIDSPVPDVIWDAKDDDLCAAVAVITPQRLPNISNKSSKKTIKNASPSSQINNEETKQSVVKGTLKQLFQ